VSEPAAGTEPPAEPPVTFEAYIAYIFKFLQDRIAAGKMNR
jgi:hypothetical protein